MSSKEEYEARRAARRAMNDKNEELPHALLDMADRLVTAIERIADALEKK